MEILLYFLLSNETTDFLIFRINFYGFLLSSEMFVFRFLMMSSNVKPIVAKTNFQINNSHLNLFTQATSFKSYSYF